MTELFLNGMRRRKKEIMLVAAVTLTAVFFMSGILMVRSILESYLLERNRESYGDWIMAEDTGELSHPYLSEKGYILTASEPCTDEDGISVGMYIGSISKEVLSFGRISFYEGRYPEKDNEIAADLMTLQKFGYSYELGQKITVRMWSMGTEPQILEKEYTLVGTVKPFKQLWVKGLSIFYPDFLLTEAELDSYETEFRTTWFYRMDPTLEKVDPKEFYDTYSETLEEYTVFNIFLYDVSLFGESGNDIVTALVIVLAVFAICFVLFSYTDRRRQSYYRLRLMGCSRKKLDLLILCESGLAVILPAAAGIAAAYFLSFLACLIFARSVGLHGFFAFDPAVFLLQLMAMTGTVGFALLFAMIRTRDARLKPSAAAVSPKEVQIIRAALPKLSCHESADVFRRHRLLQRKNRIISAVITLAVTAFLMLCWTRIHTAVHKLIDLHKEPDYQVQINDPKILFIKSDGSVAEDGEVLEPSADAGLYIAAANPYYGPDDRELAFLETLPGVVEMEKIVFDSWHLVSWEGIENRLDLPRSRTGINGKEYTQIIKKTNAAINIVKDRSLVLKAAETFGRRAFTDEEMAAFERGDCAVIMIPGSWRDYADSFPQEQEIPEEQLTPGEGDLIRIFSVNNTEGIQIPVLRIVRDSIGYTGKFPEYAIDQTTLFISENTAERLGQLEGEDTEIRQNMFRFRFSMLSSYEATDKVLSRFTAAHPNSEYYNYAENKRIALRRDVIRPILTYGSLFLMTVLIYLIVSRNLAELRAHGSLESCRKLRLIGMSERKLSLLVLKSEAREMLPMLTGFLTGSVVLFLWRYMNYIEWFKKPSALGFMSSFLGRLTKNPLLAATEWFLFEAGVPGMIVLIGLLYILMTTFGYRIIRKTFETEDIL